MKRSSLILVAIISFGLGIVAQQAYDRYRAPAAKGAQEAAARLPQPVVVDFTKEPLWAFGFEGPPQPGEKAAPQQVARRGLRPNESKEEQEKPRTVPGSSQQFSLVDIRDQQNAIDWFPEDHPLPMPDVVKHGPASLGDKKRACALCHLSNGHGRPENASVAGLPEAYILRQFQDFRNGRRYSSDPRKPNTNTMIELAKGMSDKEMKEAAAYFSAIKWRKRVDVIETPMVPRTNIAGNLFIATEKEKTQEIADRLIEMPGDEERTEKLRDSRAGFVAYVPPGTLAKGKELVLLGGMKIVNDQIVQGKTTACTACHGEDLTGVGDVPPIAGRSPSYLARQLFDIQQGTRNGTNIELMKLVVAKLTPEDILTVSAYIASRFPPRIEHVGTLSSR